MAIMGVAPELAGMELEDETDEVAEADEVAETDDVAPVDEEDKETVTVELTVLEVAEEAIVLIVEDD